MPCPECGNKSLLRSSYPLVHFLRKISSSRKRYCGTCKKFWLQKRPHYPSYFSWHHLIYLAMLGVLVYYVLNAFDKYGREKVMAEGSIQNQLAGAEALRRERMYGGRGPLDMSLEEKNTLKKLLQ